MKLRLILYGIVLALGAFALDWIEYQYFTRSHSTEIVLLMVALGFLGLGIWAGIQLTPRVAATEFSKNTAAISALGVTRREYAVLELLASGNSNKEIAIHLGVSPNTIKSHIKNLFEKLEVQRRTQAVARARSLELIA